MLVSLFLTTNPSAYNLTTWGYHDCQYEKDDGAYGGLLTKLLFRTLPSYFPRGSAYAHFPFLQPQLFKGHLEKTTPGLAEKYNWERPSPAPAPLPITEYVAVQTVLSSPDFVSAHEQRVFTSVKPALVCGNYAFKESTLTNSTGEGKQEIKRKTRIELCSSSKNSSSWSLQRRKSSLRQILDRVRCVLCGEDQDVDSGTFLQTHWKTCLLCRHYQERCKSPTSSLCGCFGMCLESFLAHSITHCLQVGIPLKWARNPNGTWPEADVVEMFQEISEYVLLQKFGWSKLTGTDTSTSMTPCTTGSSVNTHRATQNASSSPSRPA